MAIMDIIETIEKVLPAIMEGFRVARFTESVLRPDTIYSSSDQYFFISFNYDEATHVPDGRVCTNLIPLDLSGQFLLSKPSGKSISVLGKHGCVLP